MATAFESNFASLGTLPAVEIINTIKAVVVNVVDSILARQGINPLTYDMFTSTFDANSSGFDRVIEQVQITAGTNYDYVVITDTITNIVISTVTPTANDITAPATPTDLVAEVVSDTSIKLNWTASAGTDIAGYAIYRNDVKIAVVPYTLFVDKDLTAGTQYSYTIEAYDWAGNKSAKTTAVTAGILSAFKFQYHLDVGQIPAGSSDGQYDATVYSTSPLNGFYTRFLIYPDYENWNNTFPITFPSGYTWSHGHYTGSSSTDAFTQNTDGPYGGTAFPVDGDYIVDASTVGKGIFTNSVSGVQNTIDKLIIPFPTYHISGGNLQKITWTWKLRNDITGNSVDPIMFIDNFNIQVSSTTGGIVRTYNSYGYGGTHVWAGVDMTGAEGTHTIGVNNLNWATECDRIDIAYNDKYGNHVVLMFNK